MSGLNRGYVHMQSLTGAKRMVWGVLAHELAKRGLSVTSEFDEKLINLYVTLKEAGYSFNDIMMILEGYAMRLGMKIHTAKRPSDGRIIQVSENVNNHSVNKVVVINEVPKRKIYSDRYGTYVNYKREKYYFE